MATALPELIKNPLPNRTYVDNINPSQADNHKLWQAVQQLQATNNQLITYIQENLP